MIKIIYKLVFLFFIELVKADSVSEIAKKAHLASINTLLIFTSQDSLNSGLYHFKKVGVDIVSRMAISGKRGELNDMPIFRYNTDMREVIMIKKAFTMLELVFVIVVIGILAAAIIPSTRTNPVAEAAVNLLSQIRYTQHLAMVDDKYDTTNNNWFRDRWQISFGGTGNHEFSIVSNGTFAKDTQNADNNISNVELKGVTVALTGGCNAKTIISFDHLGRPMVGSLAAITTPYPVGILLTADCNITLTDGSATSIIGIKPETGYASIR